MKTVRSLLICLVAITTLLVAGTASAAGYKPISPPINTSTADKVEVLEFFWLGCPHCNAFEPKVEAWLETKPDYVAFVREAPPLNASWEFHSRSYYAARILGMEAEFVTAMFHNIHVERQPLRDPESIADLAQELGMDRDEFMQTMMSVQVEEHMRHAVELARGAGITGVPSVIINGKYLTSAKISGGYGGIIDTINEVAAVERDAMGIQ